MLLEGLFKTFLSGEPQNDIFKCTKCIGLQQKPIILT